MKSKRIALLLTVQILFAALFISPNAFAFEREMTMENEITEQRTPNSKTFDIGDGQVLLRVHSENIHYTATDGTLQDINTRPILQPEGNSYKYSNTTNSVNTYFSAELNGNSVVRVEKGVYTIDVAPDMTKGDVAQTNETSRAYATMETNDQLATVFSSEFSDAVTYSAPNYQAAFCGQVVAGGVTNSIITSDPSESYAFLLKMQGLTLGSDDGLWYLKDANGNPVFDISACTVIDEDGNLASISVDISATDSGYLLKIQCLDTTKLSGAVKASMTITISSINTLDTYVSSRAPTTAYGSSDILKVGSNATDAICRSYLKFQLPGRFWIYSVTGASLRLTKRAGATPSIKAYNLTQTFSNSTTWNSMPSYATVNASPNATVYSGSIWRMDVTSIVKSWSREDYAHYGFLIKANAENGNLTEFVSSNNGTSSYKPVLEIIAKPIARTFRVKCLYGPNVSSSLPSSLMGSAKGKFSDAFNVSFDNVQTAYNSSLTETGGCTLSPNNCTAACGSVSSCNSIHHKSGGRLLTIAADSSYNTVARFVNLRLCYYYNSGHININGVANTGNYSTAGRNALISITHSPQLNTTLHELTHVLGGSHCNNSYCIMYKYSSNNVAWCSTCVKSIRIMLQQTS